MKLVDTNPKTRFGMAKPGVADVPPVALIHLGLAMRDGAQKYGRVNYREHPVTASVYYEAAMRHLMAWWDGEDSAEDSGVHHLGHVMACCAILLDTEAQGTLNDDRPKPTGRFAELIAQLTAPMNGAEGDHWASSIVDSPAEASMLDRILGGSEEQRGNEDEDKWEEPGIDECVNAVNQWLNDAQNHAEEIRRSSLLHDWLNENDAASVSDLGEPYQRVLFANWLRHQGGRI